MCPEFPGDLVTFTGEILNENLHFLCSDRYFKTFEDNYFYFWKSKRLSYENITVSTTSDYSLNP